MTIEYKGRNFEETRKTPEAWIFYDETRKDEEEKVNKLIEILESKKWVCFCEEGWIVIPLVFGKGDYDNLVWDYKEAKKTVKIK